MAHPSPDQIADIVLSRREVYGLNIDSLIRQASNRLTARALMEVLGRLNPEAPDFGSALLACVFDTECPSVMIGFDTGDLPSSDDSLETDESEAEPSEHYLKLVFRDEHAAYYQFHHFPDLDAHYIRGAARKRAGAVQYICISLTRPEALQSFIESCRSNHHLLRVDPSSTEEFRSAPSHAI